MSDIYTTGSQNVDKAYKSGTDAVGSFDPNAWQTATSTGLGALKTSQDQQQGDYQTAFKNQILSQPSMTDAYTTGRSMYNVDNLQNTSNQLNNAMITAPQSNLDAAKGFNYDANQVGQKTSQDLQRLSPLAVAAQNNANTANQNAQGYVTQQQTQNQYELQPTIEQGQYLMDAFARQQTGFTTTQQSQLQALTDKMKAGQQLSSDEMSAYSQLASAESSYQSAMASANAQVKAAQLNNNYKTLNPSQGLYDASTGQITPYAAGSTVPKNGLTY